MADSPSFQQQLQSALSLHQGGQYEAAAQCYAQLLKIQPQHVETLTLAGVLSGQQGDFARAIAHFTQALAQAPHRVDLHHNLGKACKHQGDLARALSHYQHALSLDPEHASTLNSLGALYEEKGEIARAKSHYQRAITAKPNYVEAHFNCARLFIVQRQAVAAMHALDTTLNLQPQHPHAAYQYAQLLHEQGQLEEAVHYYQWQLKYHPEHADAHHGLAAAAVNLGKADTAKNHFLSALKYHPQHPQAHLHLGMLYVNQYQPEAALQHFLQQAAHFPDTDTYFHIGCVYMNQDKHSDAITYFHQVLKYDATHYDTHVNLGAVHLKKNAYTQAQHHYQQAQKQQPDNPELAYILCVIARALNEDNKHPAPFTRAPQAYVAHLFDQYAGHFDVHLKNYLSYQAPEKIKAMLMRSCATAPQPTSLYVADLGCGTGLCGPLLAPFCAHLMGIDLSEKMLKEAKKKACYHQLIQADIEAALPAYPAYFDWIISADVLPYYGELTGLFAAVSAALKPTGLWALTIETHHQTGTAYQLEKSARFSHHTDYITALAQQHHFHIDMQEEAITRTQANQPVVATLYVLVRLPHHTAL